MVGFCERMIWWILLENLRSLRSCGENWLIELGEDWNGMR